MADRAYERLSGLDTSFLLLESRDVYTHVASTLVFEGGPLQLADGGVDFDAITKAHEALLHRMPRYRQVLRFTPLSGQPVWVDDAHFELAYHLRHTSLPRPGTEEQLKRLSARIMQQHLDRSRPLWETWVVEGLEDGRFALISKVHHCMVDGLAGVDLLQMLLSTEPDASLPGVSSAWEPRPEPGPWQLLRDDLIRRARLPLDAVRDLGGFLEQAEDARSEIEARVRGVLGTLGMSLQGPSDTPLNRLIGPHRSFDWCTMDLSALREVKQAFGGSLNDVLLAIAAGAFRSFFLHRGVDPSELDFRALAPVSVRRREEQHAMGNRVSGWILRLPLEEPDPVTRLRRITEETGELKASKQALGAELLTSVADWTPATLLSLGARAAGRSMPFNTVITNVPGPQVPMYLLGARLLEAYPHVPLVDRVDLGVALLSYAGRIHWGLNADYDAVPDLEVFKRGIERSFDDLRRAVEPVLASHAAAEAPEDEHRASQASQRSQGLEASIRARREELTTRAREFHDALSAAIDGLERALVSPAARRAQPWSSRVGSELQLVREAIRAHVTDVEQAEGLFEEIQGSAPRHTRRLTALREEHVSLAARAASLARRLTEEGVDFGSLRREASALLSALRNHRAAESDLIYEAFWTDVGAVD